MKKVVFFFCALLLCNTYFVAPSFAFSIPFTAPKAHKKTISEAIRHAKYRRFKKAKALADPLNISELNDIIIWAELQERSETLDLKEIKKFIDDHPHWPNIEKIEENKEYTFVQAASSQEITKHFKQTTPKTFYGQYMLAKALLAENSNDKKAIELLRNSWPHLKLNTQEQAAFIKLYRSHLRPHDFNQRIDTLLWKIQVTLAKKLFPYISKTQRNLYTARIALIQNRRGLDSAIKKLSPEDLYNPGFLYARAAWHMKRKNYDRIYDLLKDVTKPMPYAHKWWKIRKRVVRELLEKKQYKKAYHITQYHGSEAGSSAFAEAEWIAGWLALRFLHQPQTAYRHFYSMYKQVNYPISKSRASYWAGRAAAANNNTSIAKRWYRTNTAYPYTFYGQLALQELNHKPLINLPAFPGISKKVIKHMEKRPVVRATQLLLSIEEDKWSKRFINHLIKHSSSQDEIAYLTTLGINYKMPHLSVEAANQASRSHQLLFTKTAYPTLNEIKEYIKDPLITHAIIRQESRFNVKAKSSANARGLMQLLPATARRTARQLHMRYHTLKLTRDPKFNIQLGSHYIQQLRRRFSGSYILSIASYNAGPTNVRRWIKNYGNPLEASKLYDVIDWIELIPFAETRNYVQRVLENIQVYQSVFNPKAPISLSSVLTYRQIDENR